MGKTYMRKVEPRVRGFHGGIPMDKNAVHRRTLVTEFSELRNFLTEQGITHGLGYRKIPHKVGFPNEYDSQLDLTRHLGTMEEVILARKFAQAKYLAGRHLSALVQAEDYATRKFDDYEEKIKVKDLTKDYLLTMIRDYMGGVSEGVDGIRDDLRKSRKRENNVSEPVKA